MKTMYNVTFQKNGVCQCNLVKTEKSPVDIEHYYRDVKKVEYVHGVKIATNDDIKPSMPIKEI